MSEYKTCALAGCDAPVIGPAGKRFCSRAHAQKFHNAARKYDGEKERAQQRARRASDPEKMRSKARQYYAENREHMAGRQKAYYHANRERCKEINKRSRSKSPFQGLLALAKTRAKEKSIAFDLSREWARETWTGKCAVTGIDFVIGDGSGPAPYSPTIDRIDRSKGYTKDNSRFVLMAVNAFKGRGTDADMLFIAKAIVTALS